MVLYFERANVFVKKVGKGRIATRLLSLVPTTALAMDRAIPPLDIARKTAFTSPSHWLTQFRLTLGANKATRALT